MSLFFWNRSKVKVIKMCRSTVEKEDIIIPQNAAGGRNVADLTDVGAHVSRMNIIMIVILAIGLVIVGYLAIKFYRKCHTRWIREEIGLAAVQRIRASLRGRPAEDT